MQPSPSDDTSRPPRPRRRRPTPPGTASAAVERLDLAPPPTDLRHEPVDLRVQARLALALAEDDLTEVRREALLAALQRGLLRLRARDVRVVLGGVARPLGVVPGVIDGCHRPL